MTKMYKVNIFQVHRRRRKYSKPPIFLSQPVKQTATLFTKRKKSKAVPTAIILKKKRKHTPVPGTTSSTECQDSTTWCELYRPVSTEDVVGRGTIIDQMNEWLISFSVSPKKQICMLWGKCGTGKTTLAHLVLRRQGYEVVEVNSSMVRSYKDTMLYLTETCLRSDFLKSSKIAVVFDEIDGAYENGNGNSITAIRDFLARYESCTISPIICICNEPHVYSIRKILFPLSVSLKFHQLGFQHMFKLAQRILHKQKISLDHSRLCSVIHTSNGDARQLIHSIQLIGSTSSGQLSEKDIFEDSFTHTRKIFADSRGRRIDGDKYVVGLLFQNYLNAVQSTPSSLEHMCKISDAFSMCDSLPGIDEVLLESLPVKRMESIDPVASAFFHNKHRRLSLQKIN